MKAIICGGRDYQMTPADHAFLSTLANKLNITEVFSGHATGADASGEAWARSRNIPVRLFPANWSDVSSPRAIVKTRSDGMPYNVLAGFWRNEEMAKDADLCIAFPGGRGTRDMIRRARSHGVKVIESSDFVQPHDTSR